MKLFVLAAVAASVAFGQTFPALPDLDAAINLAIAQKKLPGAVLVVGHDGRVIHRKAYGNRALVPAVEKMTVDTIFDCASLTKVVASTSSMMKLFEQGKVRIDDKVTDYLPEFQNGSSEITIRDLLTHYSGLRPDLDLEPPWSGYETGIQKALHDPPAGPPGVKFVYSDINFVLIGEIVRRLSGETLPEFAHEILFEPLGMTDTMFQPPATLRPRIAPTEKLASGEVLRGIVHDPTARYMGGVAGHAGLFSTADDLARFCQMILDRGEANGARLFSPLTIAKFTSRNSPLGNTAVRGLGWDIDSPLSGNRGELFPIGSFGHTGFTGTSIWIDPISETYVVLLANAVHPSRGKPITVLRGKVATIVAAALEADAPVHPTLTGLDVWEERKFRELQGKRVGLITNHTGIDRERRRNLDRMIAAGVKVTALFSPEHGLLGVEDKLEVAGTNDARTGIKVWSLYEGKNRRPSAESLRGVDVLVFDIADVGARFYTYVSTMAYAMEEAARAHIPFYVLDRPNPITGTHVEGPMLDANQLSFVGYFPLPLRHGMTVGELARMFNAENKISADLTVVSMQGWRRNDWFDATNLPWVDPSPNIRNLNEALLYPGLAMLEYSANYSVGRGTDSPFEVIGADFFKGRELALYLDARRIPGIRVYPVQFTPNASNYKGKMIEGVRFVITDRDAFDSSRLGAEVMSAVRKLYPGKIDPETSRKLIGSGAFLRSLTEQNDPVLALRGEAAALDRFKVLRDKYLLY
ncbi:MAG: hypothetical protein JWO80_5434 [Bryobacterales bacterium]|nr:hypothetical protein [Bryobacterales bacterium]